jgi:DNA-binding SARP family transcriptional activator
MKFSLLGSLRVHRPKGEPVLITRLKHRQLLAKLLLDPGMPVSGDRLVEALWDGNPPPSGMRNVKTYVWTLRRILCHGDQWHGVIQTVGDGYLIAVEPDGLDVSMFRHRSLQGGRQLGEGDFRSALDHFDHALRLWRGEALQDARGSRVLEHAAALLAEERLTALEGLSDARLALGLHAEAVADLRSAMTEHPLRERLCHRLMLALHGAGERAAALRAYQELKAEVVDDLGGTLGSPIQELYERIAKAGPLTAETTANAAVRSTARVSTSAQVPKLRQLPHDPTGFAGRTQELEHLSSLIGDPDGHAAVPAVAITGPPGAGKSALALRTAHLVSEWYPDGQLYANLRGSTPGFPRLNPVDTLGRFLRALGVAAENVPTDVDEASSMWRTHLAGRRVLVLLDDAADPDQVQPVLSVPSGNMIVVTSRETFAQVDDCAQLRLGVMKPHDAISMLVRLVGRDRVTADSEATLRLVELCGGLPLATRIAAARLVSRPGWNVADLVSRLADERQRLCELEVGHLAVRANFSGSYELLASSDRLLDRTAAGALRLMGLVDVPDMTWNVVMALLDSSPCQARRVLERLVDANLIESSGSGRYQLHDLIRLFAKELAVREETPEARVNAIERVVSLYLATVQRAVRMLDLHRVQPSTPDVDAVPLPLDDRDVAYDWLESERANLLAAASQAMSEQRESATRLGLGLVFALHWYLLRSDGVSEMLTINRQALGASHRLNDHILRIQAHDGISIALSTLNRDIEAVDHLAEQLALCREVDDRFGEMRTLGNFARTCIEIGHPAEGMLLAKAQLLIAKDIDSEVGQRFALMMFGMAHRVLGHSDLAMDSLQEALSRTQAVGDRYQEVNVLISLGRLYLDLNDPAGAKLCFLEVLTSDRTVRYLPNELECLFYLARACDLLGERDDALRYLDEAVAMAREKAYKVWETAALRDQAQILARREERDSAVSADT